MGSNYCGRITQNGQVSVHDNPFLGLSYDDDNIGNDCDDVSHGGGGGNDDES